MDNETILPAPFVKLYNTGGKYIGQKCYSSDSVTTTTEDIPTETTTPTNMETTPSEAENIEPEEPMEISTAKEDEYTILETDGDNMDCQMEETKENQSSSSNLKTKLAVALEKCLGPSLCIQQFDQLRYKIKNKSK